MSLVHDNQKITRDKNMLSAHVIIYTASYCPYCVRAKNLLESKNIHFKEIDVTDVVQRGEMIQRAGGRKTVPQIFIGETHVGGFDDLYTLDQKGDLDKMIKSY